MALFVISDLHLATADLNKSMEVFGNRWKDYIQRIKNNWLKVVTDEDTVIIPGDISWGLAAEDALPDLLWLDSLPGQKIILKGNHDFWWTTLTKLEKLFEENDITTITPLQNHAKEIENYIIAGSRGWFTDRSMQPDDEKAEYDKIVNREAIRLEMSLKEAMLLREKNDKEIIVFMHFPAVWSEFKCEPILAVLKKYEIKTCYFGHIHGVYSVPETITYEGISFKMISADFIDFVPRII